MYANETVGGSIHAGIFIVQKMMPYPIISHCAFFFGPPLFFCSVIRVDKLKAGSCHGLLARHYSTYF